MTSKRLEIGDIRRVVLDSCRGSARIRAWDNPDLDVSWEGGPESVLIDEKNADLYISGNRSLELRLPAGVPVAFRACSGDVRVSGVEDVSVTEQAGDVAIQAASRIELQSIQGDVSAQRLDRIAVSVLNGDLRARSINELADVQDVHGDIRLRDCNAEIRIARTNGDVSIRGVSAPVSVTQVNGDIHYSGNPQSGASELEAIGDILVDLDETASVHLRARSTGGDIVSDVPLRSQSGAPEELEGVLGEGVAELRAVATSGDLLIRVQDQRDAHHQESYRRGMHALDRLAGLDTELRRKGSRLEERIQRAVERATEHELRRAQHLERWQETLDAITARSGASSLDRERLAVLRMLSTGKIDAEQAEALLGALERQK